MFIDEVAARAAEDRRHKENSARLANAWGVYVTHGQGSVEFSRQYQFRLTYIEEPRMAYGCVIDLDALGELLGTDPGETPPIPHSTGYVTDWSIDNRGFYTGANLGCRVSFPLQDLVPVALQVRIEHHFTFSGVAMKDVPVNLRD